MLVGGEIEPAHALQAGRQGVLVVSGEVELALDVRRVGRERFSSSDEVFRVRSK
jgi:hypothetical protein